MDNSSKSVAITLHVNGVQCETDVTADHTLLEILRDEFHLTSCREACGLGLCGSCAVIVDGQSVSACLIPAFQMNGAIIRTAEGLSSPNASLCLVQESFVEKQAFQCSFCTPGFLMSATAMIENEDKMTTAEALSGHICRCGSYEQILSAVEQAKSVKTKNPTRNCNSDQTRN